MIILKKKVTEQKLTEAGFASARFRDDPEYANYEYGEPQEASKRAVTTLSQVQTLLVSLQKDIQLAGEFLSPALRIDVKKDLNALSFRYFG
jgi:hypothetical protein